MLLEEALQNCHHSDKHLIHIIYDDFKKTLDIQFLHEQTDHYALIDEIKELEKRIAKFLNKNYVEKCTCKELKDQYESNACI